MVLIQLVKINTLKVRLKNYYLITESIYEGVVTPSYKKLLRQMPTILVISLNRGEKPPCLRATPIRVTVMEIAENEMQTIRRMR